MSRAIVWFRRDLRLADNPALAAALNAHATVLPVYVHAPDEEAPWQPGAASRWWLHHSLTSLDADLRARGAALHVRRGETLAALRALATEGIQRGHMALHARNIALAAGAEPAEMDWLVQQMVASHDVRVDYARQLLAQRRQG